jgi:hypothetical protein
VIALIAFLLLAPACSTLNMVSKPADKLAGKWEGTLAIPNQGDLLLKFEFFTNVDGDSRGFLEVPTQTDRPMFLDNIVFDGSMLTVVLEDAGASYSGTLKGDSISGMFKQGGGELPLTITRTD